MTIVTWNSWIADTEVLSSYSHVGAGFDDDTKKYGRIKNTNFSVG